MLSSALGAVLWSFGVSWKKRRPGREGSEAADGARPAGSETGGPEQEVLELDFDPWQFLCTASGVAIAWWVFARLKAVQDSAALAAEAAAASRDGSGKLGAAASGVLPRIALSDFFTLLRAGAVAAVTYYADKPPAGALVVSTKAGGAATAAIAGEAASMLGRAFGGGRSASRAGGLEAEGSGDGGVVETLLFPGCHQGVFEELRASRGVQFECAEMGSQMSDVEPAFGNMLSLLIDAGGVIASMAALAYLVRTTSQNSFTGRHLEDGSSSDAAHRQPGVTFSDVAGMAETKEELREVIAYLRGPESFYALGARPPRGILLAGPSGTGKTLLARAVAGEAGVPFLYASSAAFVEIFVGQGAQRIRQFFEQARGCAPCIVFLDELDAVGTSRQLAATAGGNQEYAQTLNQLLLELDGIETHGDGGAASGGAPPVVVTMAATNRYDCLDEALVRPGRLDRIVMVALPNLAERVETLRIHAAKLRTEGLDFQDLASRTEGSSGADLANLLNEAALLAARRRADAVRMEHVMEVLRHPRPKQQRSTGGVDEMPFGGFDEGAAAGQAAQGRFFEQFVRSLAASMAVTPVDPPEPPVVRVTTVD